MRAVEGLQTEPAYPTVGFNVYKGRGNHIKLDGSKGALDKDGNPDWSRAKPLTKLFECKPVKGLNCRAEFPTNRRADAPRKRQCREDGKNAPFELSNSSSLV